MFKKFSLKLALPHFIVIKGRRNLIRKGLRLFNLEITYLKKR